MFNQVLVHLGKKPVFYQNWYDACRHYVTHGIIFITLRICSIYSSLLNTILLPLTAETKILRPGFTKKKHQEGLSYVIYSHR